MLMQSSLARASRSRVVGVVMVASAITLSWACSGATPAGGNVGGFERSDDASGDPSSEAGDDAASVEEAPSGPTYQGKPVDDFGSDASASIASADGYCPILDSLVEYGAMCPSCAQSHCTTALGECDPTMVDGCTDYYCPTQCFRPDASNGANACAIVMQCCPSLFGTALGLQCLSYQANSAQSACATLLSQAQALGRCQ
jgi:hypothetical protein